VPVDTFEMTRSQRRVWKRCESRFRIEYGRPSCTEEKLDLFRRHKISRELTAGEDPDDIHERSYNFWLVYSCMLSMEMRYYLDDRLVGVGIVDLGQSSLSSVYFFFDPSPEIARLSPGVYSVLKEIELAKKTGRGHLYLGLYVEDCRHLSYKSDYSPHERMVKGVWQVPLDSHTDLKVQQP
jgi:arginine-tRNA-protein transferase